ncbi:MAG: hypothetical protein ACE5IG_04905 [Dehalococcoidia bacterium]
MTIPLFLESIRLGPGWERAGPQPGLFILIMSAIVALGALGVLWQVLKGQQSSPFFEERQGVIDLAKVGIPVALAIGVAPYLGFYLLTVLYTGIFSLWYGRVRWYVGFPLGLLLAYGAYFGLEKSFKLFLLKSIWYPAIPF